MINVARQLLLNMPSQKATGRPGEEYMPPDFQPLVLPSYISSIFGYLYGPRPDDMLKFYRVRQLLTVLHSTEFVEYVTDLDHRFTYSPGLADSDFAGLFGTYVAAREGTGTLTLLGSMPAADDIGIYHRWLVSVIDESRVAVSRQTAPIASVTYDYSYTDDLSSVFDISGDELRAVFSADPGDSWRVEAYAKPTRSLGDIAAQLQSVGSNMTMPLFGLADNDIKSEPYRTFYQLWTSHAEFPYRFSGFLLALLYRLWALYQRAH